MSEEQAVQVYKCGLCNENCTVNEIQNHKCFEGSNNFFVMEDNKIYPHKGTKTLEEMLIAAVKDRPQIWNHKQYTSTERTPLLRHQLWTEIANIMNADNNNQYTIPFLKAKWKNLCDTYRVFLTKRGKSSKEQGKKLKPWKYLQQMAFVKDVIDSNPRKVVVKVPVVQPIDFNEAVYVSEENEEMNQSNNQLDSDPNETVNKILQALYKPIPAPQLVLPPPPALPETDEIASFCLMMDKKLRKLPPEIANKVMFQIHELVFQFEHKQKKTTENSVS